MGAMKRLALALALCAPHAAAEGLLTLNLSDLHSAYDQYPALLGTVDELLAQYPGEQAVILIDGDVFEGGNVLSKRSRGQADLSLINALAQRAPVIWNVGNHDFDVLSPQELSDFTSAHHVTLVSNLLLRQRGLYAPAWAKLPYQNMMVRALATPATNTYPAALRAQLLIPQPAQRLKRTELLPQLSPSIVMSHARVDRALLGNLPANTLYTLGGHSHP